MIEPINVRTFLGLNVMTWIVGRMLITIALWFGCFNPGGGGTIVLGEYVGGANIDLYNSTFADVTVFDKVSSMLISGPSPDEKSSNIGTAVTGDPG